MESRPGPKSVTEREITESRRDSNGRDGYELRKNPRALRHRTPMRAVPDRSRAGRSKIFRSPGPTALRTLRIPLPETADPPHISLGGRVSSLGFEAHPAAYPARAGPFDRAPELARSLLTASCPRPRMPREGLDPRSTHRSRGRGLGQRMGPRIRVSCSPAGWSARSVDAPNSSWAPSVPIHKETNP